MLERVNDQNWNQVSWDGRDAAGMELTGRILIVDDDPHFLRVLARILSGENFLVT